MKKWNSLFISLVLVLLLMPLAFAAEENTTESLNPSKIVEVEIFHVSDNMTSDKLTNLKTIYVPKLLNRLITLLKAPAYNPNMIWIITPLILTLLIMTLYFGKYITEELGWNTAVGNSLVLVYTSIDLLRMIYNGGIITYAPTLINFVVDPVKSLVALGVGLFGLGLMLINFTHTLPKKVAYVFSSPLPISIIAYIALAVAYVDLEFSLLTISAGVLLYFVLLIILDLIKLWERGMIYALHYLKSEEIEEESAKVEARKKLKKEIKEEVEKELEKAPSPK